MKNRIDRLMQWIFPARYSESATCGACGSVKCKSSMVNDGAYGWFCNDGEFHNFWNWNQTW